jgi:two-component system sensor histidine kinase RegB
MNAPATRAAEARELAAILAWLRLCAVGGQSLTVFTVTRWMDVDVPLPPLAAGIAALAVFAAFALWRLRRPWPVSAAEVVAHIAVDTAVLGWLLYWSGGAANPFVSLLLMPTTLAASALALRHVAVVGALSALTYLGLLFWHVPLPTLHAHAGSGDFNLHVLGMAASFAISTAMLGYFIGRLAQALRARREEVQRVRERALRDEGILAIATQAAGAAHELNTPLSTLHTLLTELRRTPRDAELADDLALMQSQVQRCRETLRELVAVGKAQLGDARERSTLGEFVHGGVERFRLLRPEIEVALELTEVDAALPLALPFGLRHALLNLLNNAADASEANDADALQLAVQREGAALALRVRDHGRGLDAATRARLGHDFSSSKSSGLGLGFALADATAERLGGTLTLHPSDTGSETVLRIPLAALS